MSWLKIRSKIYKELGLFTKHFLEVILFPQSMFTAG